MESLELSTVISKFLKCDPQEINIGTNISPAKIGGSILTARMYSEIEKIGYRIDNYWNIKTFGDLIGKTNIKTKPDKLENGKVGSLNNVEQNAFQSIDLSTKNEDCIGIDLELIENLPDADDYWNDEFYKSNFTKREIAYCTLKDNPKESFAGKIAAKESIIKLLNESNKISFSDIEILNNLDGSPYYNEQIALSISHTKNYALAVAIHKNNTSNKLKNNMENIETNNAAMIEKKSTHIYIGLTLLLISLILNILFFEKII